MVQLIVGRKGKGKTKSLLDRVNSEVKTASGNVVYLDKSTEHMFELNNRIRLICVPDYGIDNTDQFLGFVSGILSQDHDLQQMYFDSFLKISRIGDGDLAPALDKLQLLSDKFDVDFILSISRDEHELPESAKSMITIAL